MSTNYPLVAQLFSPGYTPDADADGALYLAILLLEAHDSSAASVGAQNVYDDVAIKIGAVLPQGPRGPFYNAVTALLNAKSARTTQGL